jgi:hypothetical protein
MSRGHCIHDRGAPKLSHCSWSEDERRVDRWDAGAPRPQRASADTGPDACCRAKTPMKSQARLAAPPMTASTYTVTAEVWAASRGSGLALRDAAG